MGKRLRNGMPHIYRGLDEDEEVIMELPSQIPGGISVYIYPDDPVDEVMGIPIHRRLQYDVSESELPPKQEGVIWIVSKHVADAFPERHDLAYPDQQVRRDGRTYGSRILRRNG